MVQQVLLGGMKMTIIISFSFGVLIGLFMKGIRITIKHDTLPEVPIEHNKSSVQTLPPNMREYAEKNHGMINL
jgi:hypothetical protein